MANMKILVTGAGGFVGRHVVASARDSGHDVVAIVRDPNSTPSAWTDDSGITVVGLDLTAADAKRRLTKLCSEVDAIIHAAAIVSGDADRQFRETVETTETVLTAMPQDRTAPRVVLVSSMSVYDGQALEEGETLTEDSLLERTPSLRDAYCRAKLDQERRARAAAEKMGFELWIIRPGAIFGAGRLWNGHLGHPIGPILVQFEQRGELPVSYVEHTANALILAATTKATGVEVVNVVDDDRPDRAAYLAALRQGGWPRIVWKINWRVFSALGRVLQRIPWLGRRLPGLLVPATLHARMKPIKYDNTRLHARLDIPPWPPFAQVMSVAMMQERSSQP